MNAGILVQNLGPSQLSYHVIKSANAYVNEGRGDAVCFYRDLRRACLTPQIATMHIADCWGYEGALIATDRDTANLLRHVPSPQRRVFFVYDPEWTRPPFFPYEVNRAIYGDPSLEIVVRGLDHARLLRDAFNREVKVVGEFDLGEIL